MQISENRIKEELSNEASSPALESRAERLPSHALAASIVAVALAAIAVLAAPVAAATDDSMFKLGPLDKLGQQIAGNEPIIPEDSGAGAVYSEEALAVKKLGEENAEIAREQEALRIREAEKKAAEEKAAEEAARKAAEEKAEAEARKRAEAAAKAEEKAAADARAHRGDEEETALPMVQPATAAPQQEAGAVQVPGGSQARADAAAAAWVAEQRRKADELAAAAAEKARLQALAEQQAAIQKAEEERRLQIQRAQEEEARRKAEAEARYYYSLTHPANNQFRKAVAVGGEVVPWVYNRSECPDDTAGVWRGTGDVADGEGSYIVGHNPGVFHMLIDKNIGKGDIISVWDEDGYARAYRIDDVFIIDAGTIYDDDLRARTVNSGGESVTLQTCIDDGARYKVFVAH